MEALVQQLVVGDNLVHNADAQRLLGVYVVAREAVPEGVLEPGHQRPHEAGVGAVADLRLRKNGVLRCNGYVGVEGVPGAGAHCPAVDGADDRLAQLPQVQEVVSACAAPGIDELRCAHSLGDAVGPHRLSPSPATLVVTGGEGVTGPCQYNGPDLRVGHGRVQGGVELHLKGPADGVHCLRSVESDEDPVALLLVQYLRIVCHALSFRLDVPIWVE